ncbi:hypothetical protein WR25_03368 [Diploscapter pachys]|uniref:Uncharacterized protein n=1 Tax=Diploscapter pachys TaxID=2018661 RepID=A0A2A2LKZ7_9BILA|nr:hypothetical protein WR25_03368 [Diploscapter pachys]
MITSKFCRLSVDPDCRKKEKLRQTNSGLMRTNRQTNKQTKTKTIGEKFLTMENLDEAAGREAMVNYEISEEGTEGGRDCSNDWKETVENGLGKEGDEWTMGSEGRKEGKASNID